MFYIIFISYRDTMPAAVMQVCTSIRLYTATASFLSVYVYRLHKSYATDYVIVTVD